MLGRLPAAHAGRELTWTILPMLQGILANALGLDISTGLLDTARTEAKAIGASQALTYQVLALSICNL